jgi:hypothetical protein
MKELETLEVSFADKDRRVDGIEHLTNLTEVKLTGRRDNASLNRALKQLKDEGRFQVVVNHKYELFSPPVSSKAPPDSAKTAPPVQSVPRPPVQTVLRPPVQSVTRPSEPQLRVV